MLKMVGRKTLDYIDIYMKQQNFCNNIQKNYNAVLEPLTCDIDLQFTECREIWRVERIEGISRHFPGTVTSQQVVVKENTNLLRDTVTVYQVETYSIRHAVYNT